MRKEILIDGRTYAADDSDTDAIIAAIKEEVRIILPKYFSEVFRTKLKRDYILFRDHAETERIPLPPGNDVLRQAIESEGTDLDGAVFIVSKELTDTAGHLSYIPPGKHSPVPQGQPRFREAVTFS
ncbi:MAG: hypothetical protein IJP86_05435 [Synergistaceae bacterium]|nr:hypothetical protein [Synergistaceae bacterium]